MCILFTDIESSTTLWQLYAQEMATTIKTHRTIIRQIIASRGAYEVKVVGDAFMIATSSAAQGLSLAVEIQRSLREAQWPTAINHFYSSDHQAFEEIVERRGDEAARIALSDQEALAGLRVRIGVHRCVDIDRHFDTLHQCYDYYGNDVNVAARVESLAQGGQILLTEQTLTAVRAEEQLEGKIVIRMWKDDVVLKNVAGRFVIFSVTPWVTDLDKYHVTEGFRDHAEANSSKELVYLS